jgi:hypothetical protein
MREHLSELLPLLLVGVVLLVFQLTRDGGPARHFLPFAGAVATSTPKPQPAEPPTVAPRTRTRVAGRTPAPALCDASRPSFVGGLAELKASLGASMGEALECEGSVNDQGDTQQKTTTGLAYYRRQLNAACFTTGWDHWGLQSGRLVHWTGNAVDPPGDALPMAP